MRSKILPALMALLLLVGGGYLYTSYYQSSAIEVTTPTRGQAVLAVYATGTVEASVMIPIAPRHSARLMELYADEGQAVTKGMVMAQLEDSDLQNALNDRKAAADLAQKEYDRQSRLSKSGATSKQALDKAEANLESAKANVAEAEANLSFMKLLSPENGTVIRREGEIGELIPANQPVLWLSCCKGLRVSAEVDEEDISLVKIGQDVVIRADAFPDEVFKGELQSITPKGDPVARSYRVRIELPADTKLMIGMTAETNIIISEVKDALLVPTTAVSDKKIIVVRDGKAEQVSVEIGAKTEDKIEIRKGISEGELIVIDGSQDLKTGQKISTTNQNSPAR